MPIKDNLYLYVPIRDNQNNTTKWEAAELKITSFKTKSINGRMEILTPYFSAWNADALKFYINMLYGTNDKEVTIRINNFQCDFEETIEFLNGIFEIRGNIKNHLNKPYTKSLSIPLTTLNIQMIILIYGGRMSPKHDWSNYSLEQALEIWGKFDEKIPKEAEIWMGNRKIIAKQFRISNLAWNARINLMIKGDGGNPDFVIRKRIQIWERFYEYMNMQKRIRRDDIWNRDHFLIIRTMQLGHWNLFREQYQVCANTLTNDKERLLLVTRECLEIITHIEAKIEKVQYIHYEEEEEEVYWFQYYQERTIIKQIYFL
jgi:hypothetical protein